MVGTFVDAYCNGEPVRPADDHQRSVVELVDELSGEFVANVKLNVELHRDGVRASLNGRADLLRITDETAHVIGIKQDTEPRDPEEYDLQMSTFLYAVEDRFPDRLARASIFWTDSATVEEAAIMPRDELARWATTSRFDGVPVRTLSEYDGYDDYEDPDPETSDAGSRTGIPLVPNTAESGQEAFPAEEVQSSIESLPDRNEMRSIIEEATTRPQQVALADHAKALSTLLRRNRDRSVAASHEAVLDAQHFLEAYPIEDPDYSALREELGDTATRLETKQSGLLHGSGMDEQWQDQLSMIATRLERLYQRGS